MYGFGKRADVFSIICLQQPLFALFVKIGYVQFPEMQHLTDPVLFALNKQKPALNAFLGRKVLANGADDGFNHPQ